MESITKVVFGTNLRSLFRGPKLLQRLTVGQAVPEIPLSVGSKLELHVLLRAFVFAKFPFISPYTHAFVSVCILPYIAIYMYMTEVSRVMHFIRTCSVELMKMSQIKDVPVRYT